MILNFEDYRIITDERQFVLQKKKVIQESTFTKEENIGKEYWSEEGYFNKLDSALKNLSKRVLLDNDDLQVIKSKIDQLQKKIEEFVSMIKVEV